MHMVGFFTGIALGLVLAVLGAGGGIIAVPLLLLLFKLPLGAATGSALGVVFAAAAPAAMAHWRARRVAVRTVLWFGPLSMLGAVLGAKLNTLVPERLTYALFAAVLVLATLSLFFPVMTEEGPASKWTLVAAGLGLGVLTGFLGVGGGFLIVPALARFARLPLPQAIGTSTALIAVTSLSGAVAGLMNDPSNVRSVLPIAAGAMAGALLGAPLSGRLAPGPLRAGFASLSLVVSSVMAWKALS